MLCGIILQTNYVIYCAGTSCFTAAFLATKYLYIGPSKTKLPTTAVKMKGTDGQRAFCNRSAASATGQQLGRGPSVGGS